MTRASLHFLLASRRRALVLGSTSLILIAYIDWITGPQVMNTLFYCLPMVLLTWFLGKPAGYLVSVVYTGIWLGIDFPILYPDSIPILVWNAVVRFGTFLVLTYLVDICKNLVAEIERLVEARTQALREELAIRRNSETAIHRLANQLSAAEDVERRNIAQEIHDSLGQQLSLLKLQLQTFAGGLAEGAEGVAAGPELQKTMDTLDRLIGQTRTMMFELHPGMLQDLGLVATLEQYGRWLTTQTPIRVSVSETGTAQPISMELAVVLFRATKELINNAAKHGPAQEILIQVRWAAAAVRIVVDDDGPGFEAAKLWKNSGGVEQHLGLAWIRERIDSLQGQFQVESIPGQGGTRAIIDLPLPATKPKSEDDSV